MSEQEFHLSEQEVQEFQALIQRLEEAETDNFFELAKLLGRDPKRDLVGADLSGTDLRSGDLSSADLSNANLSNTNLSSADLSNANLSNTNLSSADLSNTNLSSADLSNANLSNTNLSSANLNGTNLSDANLSGVNLNSTRFGLGLGLSEDVKFDLKQRGAIFDDSPSLERQVELENETTEEQVFTGENIDSAQDFLNQDQLEQTKNSEDVEVRGKIFLRHSEKHNQFIQDLIMNLQALAIVLERRGYPASCYTAGDSMKSASFMVSLGDNHFIRFLVSGYGITWTEMRDDRELMKLEGAEAIKQLQDLANLVKSQPKTTDNSDELDRVLITLSQLQSKRI